MTFNGGETLDFANLISNMIRDNDGFGNGNGSWLWFLLILLLFNRGGWDNGNFNNPNCKCDINAAMEAAVNKARANDLGDQVVLEAVKGNRAAIAEIANNLNIDYAQVQNGINQLNTAIQGVGNQIGLTSQQTINAIQLGNQNILQQMCSCCCDLKTLTTAGFGDLKSTIIDKSNAAVIQNMQQTTELSGVVNAGFALMGNRFNDQNKEMLKGFQEIKDLMAANKIAELQEKVSALQTAQVNTAQTAAITGYVNAALNPIQQAVNVLYERSTPAPIPAYVVSNPHGTIPSCNCGGV